MITKASFRARARRAMLDAAMVEIRRARLLRSVLYVNHLARKLRRDYPECAVSADKLRSDVAKLAAKENVPLAIDQDLSVPTRHRSV